MKFMDCGSICWGSARGSSDVIGIKSKASHLLEMDSLLE